MAVIGKGKKVKALSIRSPWWEKILCGEKTIETRTWKTNYRGDFLICATKPIGLAVGIADLVDCRPMRLKDWPAACCASYSGAYGWILQNVRKIMPFPVKGKQSLFEVKIS